MSTNEGGHWVNIIPDIHFDIIGKVPAGCCLVAILVWGLSKDPWKLVTLLTNLTGVTAVGALAAFVVCGYAVGLLFVPVTLFFFRLWFRRYWMNLPDRHTSLIKAKAPLLGLEASEAANIPKNYEIIYRHIHELLKSRNPAAALLLPKMSAEVQSCELFSLDFLIAAVWLFVCAHNRNAWFYRHAIVFSVLAVVSVVASCRRMNQWLERHFALLAIIDLPSTSEKREAH